VQLISPAAQATHVQEAPQPRAAQATTG